MWCHGADTLIGLILFLHILSASGAPLRFNKLATTPVPRNPTSALSPSYASLPKPIVSPYYLYFGNNQTQTLSYAYDHFGLTAASVAFASAPKGQCQLTNDLDGMAADIQSFIAKGGAVSLGFGGNLEDQTVPRQHIQQACTTADTLAALIKGSMEKFNTHNIEFDIENDSLTSDTAAATRLAQALAIVKQSIPDTFITYTVGTFPAQMAADQTAWVKATKDNGVELDALVLMTMDFGTLSTNDTAKDTQTAVTAGGLTLASIYNISTSDAMKKMGMLPAIGIDDNQEVLGLNGATTITQFAQSQGMSIISYWSFNRDFPGDVGATKQSLTTSSAPDQTDPYQFLKTILNTLKSSPKLSVGLEIPGSGDTSSKMGGLRLGLPSGAPVKAPPPLNKQPGQKSSLPDNPKVSRGGASRGSHVLP